MGDIPIIKRYRGVGIEEGQSPERIANIVQPEIDRVVALDDVGGLFKFAGSATNCPEARMLAAAKIEALWQLAVEDRKARPTPVTLEEVRAAISGLGSMYWRSSTHHCSLLDPDSADAAQRAVPLD